MRESVDAMAVVLVVDDGASNRELIQAYMSGIDCEVRLAEDGLSALAAIESDAPDLVPLDVVLQESDLLVICSPHKQYAELQTALPVMVGFMENKPSRCVCGGVGCGGSSIEFCMATRSLA